VSFGLVQWFPYGDVGRIQRVAHKLRTLGVDRIRTHLSWADWCRPDGPAWIRTILDELDGFDVLPVLHYTPPSFGEKPYTSSVPRDLTWYAHFVACMCAEHGARFTHVQLWNEPTTFCDWDRAADPWWRRFATMVGYAAAEARDAGKRVVMAGISPPDGTLLGRGDGERPHFLEIMEEEGALADVDVVAFHGFPGTPQWSQGWAGWDEEIGAIGAWAAARGMRTWITETGSSRRMATDRARELEDVVAAAARGGVELVYWYSVEDVNWKAQREINLSWGRDPHDYATGLTPDVERVIRRLAATRETRGRPNAAPAG
jgi:CDP-paratose 2-epimerase